jgi:hypothetical protein
MAWQFRRQGLQEDDPHIIRNIIGAELEPRKPGATSQRRLLARLHKVKFWVWVEKAALILSSLVINVQAVGGPR